MKPDMKTDKRYRIFGILPEQFLTLLLQLIALVLVIIWFVKNPEFWNIF